jgi:hypothetical protein
MVLLRGIIRKLSSEIWNCSLVVVTEVSEKIVSPFSELIYTLMKEEAGSSDMLITTKETLK